MNELVQEQKSPVHNDLPAVWESVIKDVRGNIHLTLSFGNEVIDKILNDMVDRDKEGRNRYGTPLQPFNGRDSLIDAYQEMLDGAVYIKQKMIEMEINKQEDVDFDLGFIYLSHLENLARLRNCL